MTQFHHEQSDLARAKSIETLDCPCAFIPHSERFRVLQEGKSVGIPRGQLKQLLRSIADNYSAEMDSFLRERE